MRHASIRASKEALLCIGSNCGDREGNVAKALFWLKELLEDFRQSPIYATPDCHGGQREYMNAVCIGKTGLAPAELEAKCKDFELSLGRDVKAREAGNVPVDVDIVVYDGEVFRKRDFTSDFFLIGYRELTDCNEASPSCDGD